MAATFIPIGAPATDAERQALRFLVEGLPDGYTVYGNAWLVAENGAIYEIDAIVVAPHALFVIEIKSYRGRIDGTDHDWYTPERITSPLKLNRLTALVLRSMLKRASFQAGQVWVEGLVFLSATTDVGVKGPASRDRIHTRKSILPALQDPSLLERLGARRSSVPTRDAEKDLLTLLKGMQSLPRPVRRVREFEILETLSHHDACTELLARNTLADAKRVLRIYTVPPLADKEKRERIEKRARWEAQVLGRLGRSEGILSADLPFNDEVGIVLPLEHFDGISLTTWLERYGPDTRGKERADLLARTDLWIRIAQTLDGAHQQGVVHRLLRPEVILVEDRATPHAVRVTGFDLAKQLTQDSTITVTTLADDRMIFAAPEVVQAFSSAEPASDQFSLGAILALLLTGKSLFESTQKLLAARHMLRRVRDMADRIPLSLDDAVSRMVKLRAADRFPSLFEAIDAVRKGRAQEARPLPNIPVENKRLDADNLEPKTRIGADYEIESRLGQGGMAVVYAARHLVSGQTRALKIAHAGASEEEALRGEHEVLRRLDHPNIVKVIDITKVIEGRLTLVMERAGIKTLRQWLAEHPTPEPPTQRRLAEDLLAGLDYLEQKGITHKDLKPDNLLVSEGRLTIIDFSLAQLPEDAPYGGTALYRDPASARWTHSTDRFAAALCLFELYAGRHAFDGRVPEPGQSPSVREEDIEPAGLAAFFRRALDAGPERRYPSARAMREALLRALGDDEAHADVNEVPSQSLDATTPLRLTGLPRRAVNALARNHIDTIGGLLNLSENQIRAINAIGTKTATDLIEFQAAVRSRGISPTALPEVSPDPLLVPELLDRPEAVEKLPLPDSLSAALRQSGLTTVGSVAALTRTALLNVPGIGRTRLAKVVEALHKFKQSTPETNDGPPRTLDGIWDRAVSSLSDLQRTIIERCVGLRGEPEVQGDVAADLGRDQSKISTEMSRGLERMDRTALADLLTVLDDLLDGFGGVVRLDQLGARFEEAWPAGEISGAGMVRLLVKISQGHADCFEVNGADVPLIVEPRFDRDTLRAFTAEVVRLASQWPPLDSDTARRTLAGYLPHFNGDPLALGVRLCDDVAVTETGHLFIGPIEARHSLAFVLERIREPLKLDELEDLVRRTFGADTPYPDRDHLLGLLRELDCTVQGENVTPGRRGSVLPAPAPTSDALPPQLGRSASPEHELRDMLRDAAKSRGFRMLVTPPEHHAEIGRSVAQALGAKWISFEDAFFSDHALELAMLERAERFAAQREALTEAAESTLFRLLDEHGRPGQRIVLGDTSLLGLCEALDLPRRLYAETLSGSRGFWVLVVPGVIHKQQPLFNEGVQMWHMPGVTLPLLRPLPV